MLALLPDVEQPTPHEPFRLCDRDGVHELQALIAGERRPLYRFELHPALSPDLEMGNFYVARHPRSGFVTGLVGARPAADRRYALGGRTLAVHHLGGPSERRELGSPAEVREVLERDLLIDTSGLPISTTTSPGCSERRSRRHALRSGPGTGFSAPGPVSHDPSALARSPASSRARCGSTTWRGSAAEARPASNTANRVASDPAASATPASTDPARLRRPATAPIPPSAVSACAARFQRPAFPSR